MNKSVERDFNNDENYKRLRAKQVYLFALRTVKEENAWDQETCENIAYDLTMEAITGLLTQERKGAVIENNFTYLVSSIKNALRKPKLIFYKTISKNKVDLENPPQHLSYVDFGSEHKPLVAVVTGSMDMYKVYDFIVNNNGLTDKEEYVSKLLNEGYNGIEIAQRLQTSESTVSRIIAMIRLKMGRSGQ